MRFLGKPPVVKGLNIPNSIWGPKLAHARWAITNIVQYSDKFMHGIVLHSILLLRSLLYCKLKIVENC